MNFLGLVCHDANSNLYRAIDADFYVVVSVSSSKDPKENYRASVLINLLGSLAVELELLLRLIFFGCILSLMLLWEWRVPLRKSIISRRVRWLNNFSLMVLNAALLRLTMPAVLVATAALAAREGWGLLNMVALPWFISCFLALILLDLSIYVQHLLFHMIPSLWRIHRVHHTDVHFDVTTGLRFHPFEMLLSNASSCVFRAYFHWRVVLLSKASSTWRQQNHVKAK